MKFFIFLAFVFISTQAWSFAEDPPQRRTVPQKTSEWNESSRPYEKLLRDLESIVRIGSTRCKPGHNSAAQCLLCNCANESGVNDLEAQINVSRVVFSRVKSDTFPPTVCSVVWQEAQFSWTISGGRYQSVHTLSGSMLNKCAQSVRDAAKIELVDQPNNMFALNYYNPRLARPAWRRDCGRLVASDGEHEFFDECNPGRPGLNVQPLSESAIAYAL